MADDHPDIHEDMMSHYDDLRERYGDPCPRHGTLRWGGDCLTCERDRDDGEEFAVQVGVIEEEP